MLRYVVLIFSSILLYSCASLVGVTKFKELGNEEMKTFLREQKISDSVIYFVDKDYKMQLLSLTNDTGLIKNHLQPLQASYYNKDGKLISFHINCNALGFPNLNWNYKHVMEIFPPKTQTPVDSLLNLQTHIRYLKSNTKPGYSYRDFDYFIIVYWAAFLKKQSIGLINAVNENIKLNFSEKKIKVIYVCTDNMYVE